jgi:hypothetical protein
VSEFLQRLLDDIQGDQIAAHFGDAQRYWRIAPLDIDIGFILQNVDASVEVWILDEPPRKAATVADGCAYIRDRFLVLPGAQNFTRLDLSHV